MPFFYNIFYTHMFFEIIKLQMISLPHRTKQNEIGGSNEIQNKHRNNKTTNVKKRLFNNQTSKRQQPIKINSIIFGVLYLKYRKIVQSKIFSTVGTLQLIKFYIFTQYVQFYSLVDC